MPWFNVIAANGRMSGRGSPEKIEAENEQEAAERVWGRPRDGRETGQLRAEVCAEAWLPSKPHPRTCLRRPMRIESRCEGEWEDSAPVSWRAGRPGADQPGTLDSKFCGPRQCAKSCVVPRDYGALPVLGIASPT